MPDERKIAHLLCGRIYVRPPGVSDDEAAAQLADRQHGIARRRQLIELGVSGRSIDHRVAVGRLRPLFLGVYAVGHAAVSPAGRALAGVMSVGDGTAASHWAATALHGLTDPGRGPVHVSGPDPRTRRPGLVYHRAVLPPADMTILAGVPVTTLPRTFLDLSATTANLRLRRLIKDAEFRGLVRVGELAEILERYPRRRGRRNLAAIVAPLAVDSRPTASPLEDRFLAFCARRNLPTPETNRSLTVNGRRYKPDCLWPAARLVVELDGRDAHARELAFDDDRARDRALIAAGWVPMRITSGQLAHDADQLKTEIAAALALRSADARGIDHTGGG